MDEAFQWAVSSRLPHGKIGKPIMSSREASERVKAAVIATTLSVLSLRSNPPLPEGEAKKQANGSLIRLALLGTFPQGDGFKQLFVGKNPPWMAHSARNDPWLYGA